MSNMQEEACQVMIVQKRETVPKKLFLLIGDSFAAGRYQMVLQVFSYFKKEGYAFALELCVPRLLRERLRSFGERQGLEDWMDVLENMPESFERYVEVIDVTNLLNQSFVLRKSGKVINNTAVSLLEQLKKRLWGEVQMNGGEEFNATKVNQYLKCGVKEKTLLLIESYDGQMQGNVLAVLDLLLRDERFADWKFRWKVLNADGIEADLAGERRDSRIELVKGGSLGFLEALETSQVIVTGPLLPQYYIKNQGQIVVGVFPDRVYQPDGKISQQRSFMQQSLGKLDLLYVDSAAALVAIDRWYPHGTPFRLLEGVALRHALQNPSPVDVIVSLSDSALGKLFSDVEQKFKSIQLICIEHEKTLFMRIPHKRRMSYQEENAPEVLEHVGDDVFPICRDLQGAEMLVTDRLLDVQESMKLSVPCVFLSNKVGDFYELYEDAPECLRFAGDWDEVCERLREFRQWGAPPAFSPQKQEKAAAAVTALLDKVLEVCADSEKAAKTDERGELFIFLSALDQGALSALKYYKPSADVSVLFTSSTTSDIWDGYALDERILLNVKQGLLVQDIPGDYSDAALDNEWKRMLGDRHYKRIYCKTTPYKSWNRMYACAPGKKVTTVSRRGLLNTILKGVKNPLLRNLCVDDPAFEKIMRDGELCYRIGETENEQLFLPCKGELRHPALVFVNCPEDRERIENHIGRQPESSCFLLDPGRYMEGAEVLKDKNVYWLPISRLPAKLFLCAEELVQCRDYAVYRIGRFLKKSIICLDETELLQTAKDRWTLLGIRSVEEILD